jgi:hypothetical protein
VYKVLQKFQIGDKYCISLYGDAMVLKNGQRLEDEKGNIFVIESIGMVKYGDVIDIKNREKYMEVIFRGNIENIGEILRVIE